MTEAAHFEPLRIGQVDVIRQVPELASIEEAWRAAAVAAGNLFVTPEWFFEYLEHTPAGRPAVVVARGDDGRPLAILALIEEHRVVRFPGGDYGDRFEPLILSPDVQLGKVWQTLLGSLRELFGTKLVVLDKIDRTLVSAAYATRHFEDVEQVLPYIRLEGVTWDSWFESRTANFRSEVRRKLRGMKSHGFDFAAVEDSPSAAAAMERHFELHDRRWATLEGSSTLRSQKARSFHTGLAQRIAARGWLRLWFLQAGDRVAASWYGWNLAGRYSYYQAGFDPEWSRYSPGTLMLAHTVEAALAEGASEYDLLLGDEQYKTRFATEARRAQTIAMPGVWSRHSFRVYGNIAVRRLHRNLPRRLQESTRRIARSHVVAWAVGWIQVQ